MTHFFLKRCKIPVVFSTKGFPEKKLISPGVSGIGWMSSSGVCSLELFGRTPFSVDSESSDITTFA